MFEKCKDKYLTKLCIDNQCKWSDKYFYNKMVQADPLTVHCFGDWSTSANIKKRQLEQ